MKKAKLIDFKDDIGQITTVIIDKVTHFTVADRILRVMMIGGGCAVIVHHEPEELAMKLRRYIVEGG